MPMIWRQGDFIYRRSICEDIEVIVHELKREEKHAGSDIGKNRDYRK